MGAGHPTTATLVRGSRSLVAIVLAVGVAVVAFAWLEHVNPEFRITDDAVRDQLLARDCVDLGECRSIGAATSVRGFHQGAVWVDLLVAVRLLGGGVIATRRLVLCLLALSVGTLFLTVWRWLRPSVALPAALFLLIALGVGDNPSQLNNASMAAFPDILTAAGLLCYGLAGQRRHLMLAAFALGLSINVHVSSFSLLISFLAVVVLTGPRWRRDLSVALGLLGLTYLVTSRAALVANFDGLVAHGQVLPILVGAVAIVLVSVRLQPWFRRRSWDARAWWIGLLLVLPFAAGWLWLMFWQRHPFNIAYLHPILGPVAVLAGALVSAPFELARWRWGGVRWTPTAAALGGFAVVAVLSARSRASQRAGAWTLAEATAIAGRTREMGWTYEQVPFHLQSPACRELLVGMSAEAPPPIAAPTKSGKQLQVLVVTGDRTGEETRNPVALSDGKIAVVREIDSWLRPDALIACRVPWGSADPPVCTPARRAAADVGGFTFLSRSFPEIHALDLPPPYVASYEIPLSPRADETRDLALAAEGAAGCRWRIARVEGVHVDGQLPGDHVRLRSDTGAAGLLVVEKEFGTAACPFDVADRRYPPCFIETPGDEGLRARGERR